MNFQVTVAKSGNLCKRRDLLSFLLESLPFLMYHGHSVHQAPGRIKKDRRPISQFQGTLDLDLEDHTSENAQQQPRPRDWQTVAVLTEKRRL